ncbi:MAG: protein-L-isoaspartate O-methyltransferase [Candidatus Nealsonbacteria bacterium]|nr:MAG: protein-L-isoaspartate O-methyltransferase [Candidatus Nealsonbacteria bacterium]
MALVDSLIEGGWLRTPRIIEAFKKIKRVDFLPEDLKNLAELNEALPIGYGQTISQPSVVAFMIELLSPEKGEKILDVGAGSGWTTALLAEIVGEKGKVIGLEIVPELVEFGKKNVSKYNFIEKGIVEFLEADGSKGYPKEAPFDKILCSASIQGELPQPWKEQIKIEGRIVTPIGSSIWLFAKKSKNKFQTKEYPGFWFVPLITKKTYGRKNF